MVNSPTRLIERLFSLSNLRFWSVVVWGILILHFLGFLLPENAALNYSAWMQTAAAALNVVVSAWAFRTVCSPQDPKLRRFWQLTCLALLAYLGGDIFWAVNKFHVVNTWTYLAYNIFYLISDFIFLTGVILAPTDRLLPIRRLKNFLDVVIAFLSCAFVFVVVIIHPVLENHFVNPWLALPDITFPLLNLIMLLGIFSLVYRSQSSPQQIPLVLMAGALTFLVVLGWIDSYLIFHELPDNSLLLDIGWGVMHLLVSLAALYQVTINYRQASAATQPIHPDNPLGESWTIYLLFGWLMLDIGLLVWQIIIDSPTNMLVMVLWVAVVWCLGIARQTLVITENRQLVQRYQHLQMQLEERVAARTQELKTSNAMLTNEIEMRSQLEKALFYQMNLEGLVAQNSARFINLDSNLLHETIGRSIGEIGQFIGADRGYIFLLDPQGSILLRSFGWLVPHLQIYSDIYNDLPVEAMPWWMAKLGKLKPFSIDAPSALPKEAVFETQMMVDQKMHAVIAAPLAYQKNLLGFLAFDILAVHENDKETGSSYSQNRVRDFPEQDLAAFGMFADVLAQAIERKRVEDALSLHANQMEALREISLDMTAELDLNSLLSLVSDWALRLVKAEAAGFFLYDPELSLLKLEVSTGSMQLPAGIVVKLGEGLTGRAYSEKKILMTRHYPSEPDHIDRYIPFFPGGVIAVPVLRGQDCLGVLTVTTAKARQFTPADINILTLFAAQAAIAIYNAQLYGTVHSQAITDPLTEVFNRRHFFKLAEVEIGQARRYHKPLAVLILDIDHFKSVNDQYGHLVGDDVLRLLVARCEGMLRERDLFSRFGGEEFIVLLPDTDAFNALAAAERLRCSVQDAPFMVGSVKVFLTISIGLTTLSDQAPDMEILLKQADQAMYAAKNSGRNRVVVWAD